MAEKLIDKPLQIHYNSLKINHKEEAMGDDSNSGSYPGAKALTRDMAFSKNLPL
ncbi:MAG: hypothetical protein IK015_05595 [Treponema sp.]|nr:hypothetical protein [Treponema sp.]